MANMDYPGPCFACSAINGCDSEAQRKEGIKQYCKGLEMELNAWKARLYDVLVKVDEMNAANKEQVEDTLALIKSTMKELEAVMEQMQNECPTSIGQQEKTIGGKLEDIRVHYTKALQVISPGWFGG